MATPRVSCLAVVVLALTYLACLVNGKKFPIEVLRQQFMSICNDARSKTSISAANMKILVWDDKVAEQMQNYTDSCSTEPRSNDPPTYFLLQDQSLNFAKVAKTRMVGMENLFDFNTGGCYNTTANPNIMKCRHPEVYGRIIQAGIERVGCGMTPNCPPKENGVTTYVACAIARGDDQEVVQPFIPGPRCSACPSGWNYCVRGLCSKVMGTTRPTNAPTTGKPTPQPTRFPTRQTKSPTTRKPTHEPTRFPTRQTKPPTTRKPTHEPTRYPTHRKRSTEAPEVMG